MRDKYGVEKWAMEVLFLEMGFDSGYSYASKQFLTWEEWCNLDQVRLCSGETFFRDWLHPKLKEPIKVYQQFWKFMEGARQAHKEMLKVLAMRHVSRVKIKMNGEWYYAHRSILDHEDYEIEKVSK